MLEKMLQQFTSQFHCILPEHLQHGAALIFNLNDKLWQDAASCSVEEQIQLTHKLMSEHGAVIGIGRYAEDRQYFYQTPLFLQQEEPRSIHLGIDLTVAVGTPVFSPLPAIVHSFADNDTKGDYGPTIILQHELEGSIFFTLYGHLSRSSLSGLKEGQSVLAGEQIAQVGAPSENGGWPPHLHFQVIHDLLGMKGDYPGVARHDKLEYYLTNCPNPAWILFGKDL